MYKFDFLYYYRTRELLSYVIRYRVFLSIFSVVGIYYACSGSQPNILIYFPIMWKAILYKGISHFFLTAEYVNAVIASERNVFSSIRPKVREGNEAGYKKKEWKRAESKVLNFKRIAKQSVISFALR